MAVVLTVHQGGAETVQEKVRAALVALEDVALVLEPTDFLLPAVEALVRAIAHREGR